MAISQSNHQKIEMTYDYPTTVHFLSLSSTKIRTLSKQRIMMSTSVLLKAHVYPKCIAHPVIQKNDFG